MPLCLTLFFEDISFLKMETLSVSGSYIILHIKINVYFLKFYGNQCLEALKSGKLFTTLKNSNLQHITKKFIKTFPGRCYGNKA
jgi:hypothetical protein